MPADRETRAVQLTKAGALVAATAVAATSLACCGFEASTIVGGAADFAVNILANAGFAGIQTAMAASSSRSTGQEDENHVILSALRTAQLRALEQVHARWTTGRCAGAPPSSDAAFGTWLTAFIANHRADIGTREWITQSDKPGQDALPYLPSALDAGLAARHGMGPALNVIQAALDAAVIEELRASQPPGAIPETFVATLQARDTGFYALFVAEAAAALRDDEEFERIWNAEQVAMLGHISTEIYAAIADVAGLVEAATTALKRQGAAIDIIAGQLRSIDHALRDITATLHDERNWLRFDIRVSAEGWLRFSSYNPAIPFQGRTSELSALDTFLQDPRPFAWWAATGPGGSGKTRLALELCWRAHRQGWRVGFLRRGDAHAPPALPGPTWRATRPTLIIADYAAEQVATVSRLVLTFSELPDDPAAPPTRLLMLERQIDDQFWQAFSKASTGDDGLMERTRYGKDLLAVPDLSDEDLWHLVLGRPWQPKPTPLPMPRPAFFARLQQVDRGRRALVAMLLADAPDLTGDLATVLRKLLARETAHWRQSLPDEAPVLIAAATMLGTLQGDMLAAMERKLGRTFTARDAFHPCARTIGAPVNTEIRCLDSLQPDLIGEFYTLETLRAELPDPPPYPWLAPLCWVMEPARMQAFVPRAIGNFPSHPAIPQLIEAPTNDPAIVQAMIDMMWITSTLAPRPGLWEVQKRLAERARGVPAGMCDEPSIRLSLSVVLYNTLYAAKQEGDLPRRDELLRDLRDLAAAWPEDPAVREPLAKGLFNMLNDARQEGDLPRRDDLLRDLRDLAAAWPEDPAVREQLAKGLFSTLNDAKQEGDLPRRDELLRDLRDLAAAWPEDPAVREQLAKSLYNTLYAAKQEGDLPRRDDLLRDLRDLAAAWPEDPAVREQLAKGLYNTLYAAKQEGDLPRRDELLRDLRDLAAAWPEDPAVREQLARAFGRSVLDAMQDDDALSADKFLTSLQTLAGHHPDDATLQEAVQLAETLRRDPGA